MEELMPETPDLFNEVAIMRDELEEQGAMLDALVRASGAGQEILDRLSRSKSAARVLLAVDGVRTQGQIADHLNLSQPTVSRALNRLANDYGLVAISHRDASGKVYHRTRLDRALSVSRGLNR
jgi:DNA-binding MarR family transcriptional regulator